MNVDAYLARIRYDGARDPNANTLRTLQLAHLQTVPFDALDCLLGPEPSLDPDALYDKIVTRRRGGFCFELNGLFALLLRELGFAVTMLAARPFGADGSLAPERAHLTLLVPVGRTRWLADVGFGNGLLTPLDLDEAQEQFDGRSPWIVQHDGEAWTARQAGMRGHENGYVFTLEPRTHGDFEAQCHAYATDPDSPFRLRGPCWKMTEHGWIGVRRHNVAIVDASGYREEPVPDEATWKALLFEHFGYRI